MIDIGTKTQQNSRRPSRIFDSKEDLEVASTNNTSVIPTVKSKKVIKIKNGLKEIAFQRPSSQI